MPELVSGAQSAPATRPLPRGGERIPAIGVGTWRTFDVGSDGPARAELKLVMRRAAEVPRTMIDSSPMYGEAERVVGDLSAETATRDGLFFATKVWTTGRDAGIRQMEQSFRLMRAAKMDLMQIHNLVDVAVHTRTLQDWKASGRIRHLGITHYEQGAYAELERLVRTKHYDFAQFNFSMDEPEAEQRLLSACADAGVAVIVNRPFAHGSLFARVRGKSLPAWCGELQCTSWAQYFLKWILGHPAVTCVIPGTGRAQHLDENRDAAAGPLPDAAMRRRMSDYLRAL